MSVDFSRSFSSRPQSEGCVKQRCDGVLVIKALMVNGEKSYLSLCSALRLTGHVKSQSAGGREDFRSSFPPNSQGAGGLRSPYDGDGAGAVPSCPALGFQAALLTLQTHPLPRQVFLVDYLAFHVCF